MKRALLTMVPFAFIGCGSGTPPMNTKPMNEEEIRQMKEDDRRIDEEERGGSGTAVAKPKRKR